MKRQKLKLKVVDHRDGSENIQTFDDHREYLQAVGRVTGQTDVHVSEQTATVVHLYGKDQIDAFKNPKQDSYG